MSDPATTLVSRTGIRDITIENELRTSYLNYSMSVIVSRALPDARDGLKPVHRRIITAMNDLHLDYRKKHVKCAKVVGHVLGNYHPHGDSAVYDALVRVAQDFSVRYLLVDGHGNFGSIDGDGAAAYRYTECRMHRLADELLEDLDKDTVDFVDNFDGTGVEPVVLPCKVPLLLLNGTDGIAVGMATKMAPHNLTEVCNGVIELIKNPDATTADLMKHIKGPDFPTGALICGREGIKEAYETGRGRLVLRAKCHIETQKNGRQSIVVTEIPYQVNKAALQTKIAEAFHEDKIRGIAAINDYSNKDGIRLVVDLKQGENAEVVLNQLYKFSALESSFSINSIALVKGRPEILPLRDLLRHFIDHRYEVLRRRTIFLLHKAEARVHILIGLLVALDNIDRVIELIRNSQTVDDAKAALRKEFNLSDIQAHSILEMQLRRLTGLQRKELEDERDALLAKIAEYQALLADRQKLLDLIVQDCRDLIDKYGKNDPRRSEIVAAADEINVEDLIADEEMTVGISHKGYIKRISLDTYRKQGRGGKGVTGAAVADDDFVEHLFIGSTHDYLLFFTSIGKIHWLKIYDLPQMGRAAKGRPLVNLLQLENGETVQALVPVRDFDEAHFLVLVTKKGTIKKTVMSAYARPQKGGIRAINIDAGDALIAALVTNGENELMLASREGMACRFKESDVRAMGRAAGGVIGMNLENGDEIVGAMVVSPETTVLTVADNGLGKRSSFEDYRLTKRGAKGVTNMKLTDRTGKVVACMAVREDDDVVIITTGGMVVRTPVNGCRVIGRATQGVKVIGLKDDDKVATVARAAEAEEREDGDAGPTLSQEVPEEQS
ncbi:MAG: DNA gyrase subunit A [Planctomycetota bacterium]|jgi:DNA gyrase subunit A|nr:DNA gyrase subunit A [Planctomycetota bacterium]